MINILLVIHLMLAIGMIGVVLLQRSEGGGLGIGGGGGGGGMSGFLTGRGTANLLTRTTAILAGCFMATSILLSVLHGGRERPQSIIDQLPVAPGPSQSAPATPPATAPAQAPTEAPAPSQPTVPVQ
jgi:preprotein translocase subunit SecG